MEERIRNFENPPKAYRAKPFWAWNGKLEEEELLRQIDIFREMGFGGFFMHSRTGLRTGYLSEEWFSLTDSCVRKAEEDNLEPWIYDEDRWPSGSAGGYVTREPRYRRKYLTLTMNEEKGAESPLVEFAGVCTGLALSPGYRRISWREPIQAGETRMTFRVRTMEPQSAYNGFTDADRLNLDTTERFLEITHRQYQKKCAEFSRIQGVFTDEPHRGMVFSEFSDGGEDKNWSLPWTEDLPSAYFCRFGEDLLGSLPELFLQLSGEPVAKIKWQYMELLQELFEERYLQPIQAWAHGCKKKTTGHFLHEDSLTAQAVPTGSMMRCYAYLDEPGIDNLTERNFAPWAVKQLESVARQLGKQKKLSELYGGTGWQMSFRDYKYVGDWQVLLGINVRCPHLAWYTMAGQAKRDYPGSFLHQATWWQEHEALEAYFARLGYLASVGKPVCDTLVLHPVESLWYRIHPGWVKGLEAADSEIQKLEKQFRTFFHWLMESQVDFDYGDEGLLEKHAVVSGRTLWVGKMAYRRILIAGCPCIRESTCRLIRDFQRAGGEVVFFGAVPQYVGGVFSGECRRLSAAGRHLPMKKESAAAYFQSISKPVSIPYASTGKDLYMQIRQTEDGFFVLLWNKNRSKGLHQVPVNIPSGMSAQLWDCTTGQRRQIGNTPRLDFGPGQERVLYLSEQAEEKQFSRKAFLKKPILPELTGYSLNEPNVLPLDRASLYVENRALGEEAEILCLDRRLRETLGLALRKGDALQPWAKGEEKSEGVPIRLQYGIFIEEVPHDTVYLAMEPLKKQSLQINGIRIPLEETRTEWVDRCYRIYSIPKNVWQQGENCLELFGCYGEDCGLEAMFLLGKFGVWLREGTPSMGSLPPNLHHGSLVSQGLPFYTGKVRYIYEGVPEGTYLLKMPKIGGSCARVFWGNRRKTLLWPWQETEISLERGQTLILEAVLTRRNAFGPLHLFPRNQPYIAPDSFENGNAPGYSLFPTGLLQKLTLYPMKEGENER